MGPRRAAVPILMLVSTSACATGGARSSSACSSDLTPSPSSVSAVLDSAAVASGLQAVLAARTDLVLATVTAARDDGPRSGQIFAEGLEDSDRTRIREILEASNRLEEGSDERVRLVLRDEAGIRVRRVDRFAQCAPRIRNRPTLQRRIAAEAAGLKNVTTQLGGRDDVKLAPESVDLIYTCDTYHHFEQYPEMLASIHQALVPGGLFVVVDFERIEGVSREWIMGHVRAGKETVRQEIEAAGFEFLDEVEVPAFAENYLLRFRRPAGSTAQ